MAINRLRSSFFCLKLLFFLRILFRPKTDVLERKTRISRLKLSASGPKTSVPRLKIAFLVFIFGLFLGSFCSTFQNTQCADPNLKSVLSTQCPALCGTCAITPGCTDTTSFNCAASVGLCNDVATGWGPVLKMLCPKTCGSCAAASRRS